jgi:hypothetical protein
MRKIECVIETLLFTVITALTVSIYWMCFMISLKTDPSLLVIFCMFAATILMIKTLQYSLYEHGRRKFIEHLKESDPDLFDRSHTREEVMERIKKILEDDKKDHGQ